MKTSSEKLTATRINVRFKVSELKDVIEALDGGELNDNAEKFLKLAQTRLDKALAPAS